MKKEWDRDAFVDLFHDHADEEQVGPMSTYMKNKFPFLGIRSPLRIKLLKLYFAHYEMPKTEELFNEAAAIFQLPEREFQYAAIAILDRRKKQLAIQDLTFLETLIVNKSWWDSIDSIAPKLVGTVVLQDREVGEKVMKEWSSSQNMWLNRSAILHQLKYKSEMNEELLYPMIHDHISSEEFFIQKAIGWVLREYAKTNPQSVLAFVNSTELKPLSRREALKHIGE